MVNKYRFLILTEKISKLTDLASALEISAQNLEVVAVEEVDRAIGRLWMGKRWGYEQFHLVLLPDVESRGTVDGMVVLKHLSQACCIDVAPVILTTSVSADRAIEVLRAGAWEYLSLPPFNLSAFGDLMRTLGEDVERGWAWEVDQGWDGVCRNGFRRKMVRTMMQWFNKDLSLEEISQELSVIPSSLHRYFVEELGESIHDFVRQWRLQGARVLLRETEEPAYIIADRLGFSSQQSFTNIFTTYVGCTPTAFRALMRRRESYLVYRPFGQVARELHLGACPKFLGVGF